MKNLFKSTGAKVIGALLGVVILFMAAANYKREQTIKNIIAKIKNDTSWYASVQAKATANGISVEEQLRLDAIYLLQTADKYQGLWWNF